MKNSFTLHNSSLAVNKIQLALLFMIKRHNAALKTVLSVLLSLLLTTFIIGLSSHNSFAQIYTFTTAGSTGNDGPTQTQVTQEYNGTSLSGQVTVDKGIQYWKPPASGTYTIEVWGAAGYGPYGGRGAYMSGTFVLSTTDELHILVGQEGGCCVSSGTEQYGGGGGTFVVEKTNNTPLIIAGGGGSMALLPSSPMLTLL